MIKLEIMLLLLAGLNPVFEPLSCFPAHEEPTDYQVTASGQVYRHSQAGRRLPERTLVADLSGAGWRFTSRHRVVQSQMSLTAYGAHQVFEQLLLLAYDPVNSSEQMLALRIFPQQSTPWQFEQIQSYVSEAEFSRPEYEVVALWHQQQQAAGWRRPLAGLAMQLPELYAGVLYLPVLHQDTAEHSCPDGPVDISVLILHMHSGHSLSPGIELQLEQAGPLRWQLIKTEQRLALWLLQEEQRQLVQPEILEISSDCLNCVQALDLAEWPQQRAVAQFWLEEGAY
ncbi:hypothetical protein [Alkalimonas mucilaginosa]|uniref:Uncharacterized protein n=1 Tax=Alkalimonas mucilaginosa TaxID=3057676 RepID=A0ABU7JG26_9GAMM|nr:hypothetical protein [Alkalimonas sp. MEB004]MEE2024647.1 hypothetical protein [Alkalimonas sp. MEB004]